ncbi:MAG: DUF1565 domain-containing protein, partial [Methanosphaera sp.]|nr:DUF1565 domain-containing protein [Methanosphaera sp.]
MNKNVKSIFFVLTILTLLVAVSTVSAGNLSDNTTTADAIAGSVSVKDVSENAIDNSIADTATAKNIKKEEQTTDLYVSDTTGSDDNSGTNTSPYKTIQKALDQTTADSTFNIHIAEGTYKGLGNTNLTVNGENNINIIGEGINKTVIDGEVNYTITTNPGYVWGSSEIWWPYINDSGNYAMTISEGNGNIQIKNLSISHMWCSGGDAIESYPHAPVDNYGNLIVDNVDFYYNCAGVGSAIRNNLGGTLLVNNSFFEENRKSSSTGNEGIIYNNGTATIINSIFDHNYARWGTILNDKNITVINTTLSNGIAYDGASTYKYGAGIAYNTGQADFFNIGFFETHNEIYNCTFINNEQTDIYGYSGEIIAIGNNIINSTGIRLLDNMTNSNIPYTIANNTITGSKVTTITVDLSSSSDIYSIYAHIFSPNLVIENNTIINGSNIILNVNNSVIRFNSINTTEDYAIVLNSNTHDNIIANNTIYSKYNGDLGVYDKNKMNIVE